jgi:hypothetical protein
MVHVAQNQEAIGLKPALRNGTRYLETALRILFGGVGTAALEGDMSEMYTGLRLGSSLARGLGEGELALQVYRGRLNAFARGNANECGALEYAAKERVTRISRRRSGFVDQLRSFRELSAGVQPLSLPQEET